MTSTSKIILDQEALTKNIRFLKRVMGKKTRISSVVKANAYGHGIEYFVPMAEKAGIDHFSVFSADEALRVFKTKKGRAEIMIMGWLDSEELEWVIKQDISFYVFELGRLIQAGRIAKKLSNPAMIHLELETGMNRTGLNPKDLQKAIAHIRKHPESYSVSGLCTHFAGAESIANYYRINHQIRDFKRSCQKILAEGIRPRIYHTACSAAALNFPETRMDLVRIGIAQYGFWPSKETLIQYLHGRKKKTDPLKRVMSWKSRIMSIKKVRTGEFISYGTTYLAQEDKRIAIIPVGYSNGYNRSLSNQGRILIAGQRVAVIGMVNMNMLIADISGIPEARVGDEVVLIGKQGDLEISVASFSEISEQLNYELLSRLPQNILRTVNDKIMHHGLH